MRNIIDKSKKVIFVLSMSLVLTGATVPIIPAKHVAAASTTVYTTETGKRYHSRKNCSGLNNANKIYTDTIDNAKKIGLTKCKKCW